MTKLLEVTIARRALSDLFLDNEQLKDQVAGLESLVKGYQSEVKYYRDQEFQLPDIAFTTTSETDTSVLRDTVDILTILPPAIGVYQVIFPHQLLTRLRTDPKAANIIAADAAIAVATKVHAQISKAIEAMISGAPLTNGR